MMLIRFADVFRTVLMRQQQPLPLYLQMELVTVAVVLVLPIVFYWYRLRQTAIATILHDSGKRIRLDISYKRRAGQVARTGLARRRSRAASTVTAA
jgi:hypothetical protein